MLVPWLQVEQERGSRVQTIIDGFGAGGSDDADEDDSADEMTRCARFRPNVLLVPPSTDFRRDKQ